jgi:carboxylesterase
VATDHFDLLADLAEEVSLVGHSMGGLIGTAVTKRRKVKHLILSAPGLYPVPGDVKYKEMLTRPVLSGFYMNLIPYLPKPMRPGRVSPSDMLDEERCKEVFQYLAVPVNAVAEVFRLQNETEILDSQYDRLTIVYGTHDLTVNMDPLFERLDQADKPYDVLKFENSAHSVLEDHERVEACKAVLRALQA